MSAAARARPGEPQSGLAAGWSAGAAVCASPLFDAVRAQLDDLCGAWDVAALNSLAAKKQPAILSGGGVPLRFVVPAPLAARSLRVIDPPYELRAFARGEVETRAGNWHDAFNALTWLAWPRAKAALNAVHFRHALADGSRRGAARDLATLFDEGGAVIACSDPALAALVREFRWKEAFCERRAGVLARMRCYLFGHALLDKARAPYKAMTAHALIFPVPEDFFSQAPAQQISGLDAMAAAWFADDANLASTAQLAPLPLLGFPGFCEASKNRGFYDDVTAFRTGRMRIGSMTAVRQS